MPQWAWQIASSPVVNVRKKPLNRAIPRRPANKTAHDGTHSGQRQDEVGERLQRIKFRNFRPARKNAGLALVGLLTSEPPCPAFSSLKRQWQKSRARRYRSVTAAGTVPDSHRIPCCRHFGKKLPTTNALDDDDSRRRQGPCQATTGKFPEDREVGVWSIFRRGEPCDGRE